MAATTVQRHTNTHIYPSLAISSSTIEQKSRGNFFKYRMNLNYLLVNENSRTSSFTQSVSNHENKTFQILCLVHTQTPSRVMQASFHFSISIKFSRIGLRTQSTVLSIFDIHIYPIVIVL